MKRFAALALVLIGLGMPAAFGQRGGGHGGGFGGGHGGGFGGGHGGGFGGGHGGGFGGGHGFSGGSAGTFHGGGFAAPHFSSGFSAPRFSGGFAARRFSGGYAAPRTYGYRGNARYQTRYYGSYPTNSRSGYGYSSGYGHSGSGHHNGGGFHWSIRTVPTYGTLVPGWLGLGPYGYYPYGYGLLGWDDDSSWSSDDPPSAAPQGYDPGYEQAPEQQEQPVYRPEYQPSAVVPAPTADPENQSVTTIVLNDGRSVQIHNYALTPTTLYVLDGQRRNIPLEDINIAATQKANRAVGIDFQVPKIAQ